MSMLQNRVFALVRDPGVGFIQRKDGGAPIPDAQSHDGQMIVQGTAA
jgi:hypothetical protein